MATYDLIAVHTIVRKDELAERKDAPETIAPGKSFTVSNKDERDRLIATGAAKTPVGAARDQADEEAAATGSSSLKLAGEQDDADLDKTSKTSKTKK